MVKVTTVAEEIATDFQRGVIKRDEVGSESKYMGRHQKVDLISGPLKLTGWETTSLSNV